jgi:hypothetical protein
MLVGFVWRLRLLPNGPSSDQDGNKRLVSILLNTLDLFILSFSPYPLCIDSNGQS